MCQMDPEWWNSNAEPFAPRGDPRVWAMRQLAPLHASAQAQVWYYGHKLNLHEDPVEWTEPSAVAYAEILDPATITQHALQPLILVDGAPAVQTSTIARVQYLASIAGAPPRAGAP